MNESAELDEAIRLLRKPLEFAAGLSPRRLQVIPDLEKTLTAILGRHPVIMEAMAEFRSALAGLDALSGEERMSRIITLVRILDRVEKGPARRARASLSPELKKAMKDLETEAQYIKGVGPRMAEKLARLKINTVEDLLFHLPARYEDRRDLKKIRDVVPDQRATVLAEVMVAGAVTMRGRGRRFQMMLSDGTGMISAKWFNYRGDYLEKRFRKGQKVVASGLVKVYKLELEMHHPDVEIVGDDDYDDPGAGAGIVPVYPLTEGVFQKQMRRIVANAVSGFADRAPEVLPEELRQRRSLPGMKQALEAAHSPPDDADLGEYQSCRSPAHRRLAYEEFFFLELGLALRRRGVIEEPAMPMAPTGELTKRFLDSLPFSLTSSQEKVIGEIGADLGRSSPMHRLLQGDVGSGKTVVALFAAVCAIESGFQVALMAPTEVLAEQHARTVEGMLGKVGIESALLTGAIRGPEREEVLSRIAGGRVPLVVGTHAVIQDKVSFKRLGLGIIDEQHRFGVMQRARLKAKGPGGATPHLLVMTATPIPRSLAMTLYGDLSVSMIREMPPGRIPVETRVFRESRRSEVYSLVREEAGKGRQAFIVYPLVEESEKLELKDAMSMYARFRDEVFPELRVGLVHGRMKSEEKEGIMRSFERGEIDVLVSTTVVEVGIDVPNATMMVVEHADRFGLSQLHQLRGRVGRGGHASQCCLISGYAHTEDSWRRLVVMEKTDDGFRIAEEDLAMRGPGEFFGTRQWGLPDFRVANIIRDAEVLSQAREDAFALVDADPRLEGPGHAELLAVLKKRWGRRLRLGSVG